MELLEGEVFKPIPGYEGLYEISTHGRVKALEKYTPCGNSKIAIRHRPEKLMKLHINPDGYSKVQIFKESKYYTFVVHRMVVAVFVGMPEWADVIDHIDGNPQNNHFSNLRPCLHRENSTFDNIKRKKAKVSIYRGVFASKNRKRFFASIYYDGKTHCLGYYGSEIEAHNAYETAFAERVKISKSLPK